jgi:hypothetical protein
LIDPRVDIEDLPAAADSGRICATAGQAQRDVQEWAARYGSLFSAKPFDSTLFNTVCLCTAFSAPWLAGAELRTTNRAAIWGFGVDWLIDYKATSQSEVHDIVRRCIAVAEGDSPIAGDDLARALADIRDDLSAAPAYSELGFIWRDELQRFLEGMAREWDWVKAHADGGKLPSIGEYLGNADNLGFSFAFASHWIGTGRPPFTNVEDIRAASGQAQRVMRIINDMGTYERDMRWGDLNALMLGVTHVEACELLAELADEFRGLADPLRANHAELAYYMERQLAFCD